MKGMPNNVVQKVEIWDFCTLGSIFILQYPSALINRVNTKAKKPITELIFSLQRCKIKCKTIETKMVDKKGKVR